MRCAAWAFLLALVISYPSWARKSKPAAEQAVAQQSLQEGILALINRDFTKAGRAFANSFRKSPQPLILYYLGALAQAEGRSVDAQDLMRRYLFDSGHEGAAESPEQQEAERIIALPQKPHGKLQILGDSGTLIFVDGRLVGALPLSQPLIMTPGKHQIGLELREQKQEEPIEMQPARFVELRHSAETHSALVSVVPVMLLIDNYASLPASLRQPISLALEETLKAEHYSALRQDEALTSSEDHSLAACLNTLPCQARLAHESGAEFALRATLKEVAGQSREWVFDLIHAEVGELAASVTVSCPSNCGLGEAKEIFLRSLPGLITEAKRRPFGRLILESSPIGAEVFVGERRLGLTPLNQLMWAGPLEVELRRPGTYPERRQLTIPSGDKVVLSIELRAELSANSQSLHLVRPPRPRWRYYAGAGIAGAGLLMIGVGASALAVNGSCVGGTPPSGILCLNVHDTSVVGGALLGVGFGIIGVGALFIAVPQPLQLESK